MIDQSAGAGAASSPTGKILKFIHVSRIDGTMPAWVNGGSAKEEITWNVARNTQQVGNSDNSFKSALAYQVQDAAPRPVEEFGFADLLDIINPLQHIPVVNTLYRQLTGDKIKSVPDIIGGAIFGGPIGAGVGLVNAIAREETGRDLGENAFALVSGEKINFKHHGDDTPQARLAEAVTNNASKNELPVSLLAFTDTGMRSVISTPSPSIQKEIKLAGAFSAYEIY